MEPARVDHKLQPYSLARLVFLRFAAGTGHALSRAPLFRVYVGYRQFVSNLYAVKPSSSWSTPTGGIRMLDLLYLALGLGLFALMGLYARWAANA